MYVNDALIGGESFRSLQRAFTNKQMDPRNEQGKLIIIRLNASSPAVLREILTTSKIKLKDNMQARVMRHVYARVEPLLTTLYKAAFPKQDARKNKNWGPAGVCRCRRVPSHTHHTTFVNIL